MLTTLFGYIRKRKREPNIWAGTCMSHDLPTSLSLDTCSIWQDGFI